MVGISVPTSFYWILICTKDLLDGSSVLGVCKGIQKNTVNCQKNFNMVEI